MDIREAAKLLHCALARRPWYMALDISERETPPALFVYVNSLMLAVADLSFTESQWHGFPVRIRELGLPVRRSSWPAATGEPLSA
jgi:hypothetical protein